MTLECYAEPNQERHPDVCCSQDGLRSTYLSLIRNLCCDELEIIIGSLTQLRGLKKCINCYKTFVKADDDFIKEFITDYESIVEVFAGKFDIKYSKLIKLLDLTDESFLKRLVKLCPSNGCGVNFKKLSDDDPVFDDLKELI